MSQLFLGVSSSKICLGIFGVCEDLQGQGVQVGLACVRKEMFEGEKSS